MVGIARDFRRANPLLIRFPAISFNGEGRVASGYLQGDILGSYRGPTAPDVRTNDCSPEKHRPGLAI